MNGSLDLSIGCRLATSVSRDTESRDGQEGRVILTAVMFVTSLESQSASFLTRTLNRLLVLWDAVEAGDFRGEASRRLVRTALSPSK